MSKGNLVLAWALLVGMAVGNFTPYVMDYFEARPYKNVKRVSVDWDGIQGLEIIYTFFKVEGCEIKDFGVIGFNRGVPEYLSYTDLDENVPVLRQPGEHSLKIAVDLKGNYYEKVEIRTTHLCSFPDEEPELVNRIFATIYQEDV